MLVLYLGNIGSPIIEIIKSSGGIVVTTTQPLTHGYIEQLNPDFIVSFGYPHIVPSEVIKFVNERIINLHLSYLPWNRGSDPDFWSLVEDTPKGVTIHYMNETLDTGDIIVQTMVSIEETDTLSTYGRKLKLALVQLFRDNWESIRSGSSDRVPQGEGGSYHRSVDKNALIHLLKEGANTSVLDMVK